MLIDYCNQLLAALEGLEKSIFKVEDLENDYKSEVKRRLARRSVFISAIFPILFIIWYTLASSGMFGEKVAQTSEQQSFWRMFAATLLTWILGFILTHFLRVLWARNILPSGQDEIAQRLLPKYNREKELILQDAEQILMREVIHHPKLPAKYLNRKSVAYIVQCLQNGEAKTLEQAIGLLELESQDSQVHDLVLDDESLLTRVQKVMDEDLQSKVLPDK